MFGAFWWGAARSGALPVGALIAYRLLPGPRLIAVAMALGAL
jgi:hypothetical protein